MRRIIYSFLLLTLAFSFTEVQAEETIGRVNKVDTYAYGTRVEQTKNPLYAHDKLYQQQILQTVTGGAVALTFADGSKFFMGSDSEVVLDEFVYDSEGQSLVVKLGKGLFRFITGTMTPEAVQINTPTATIGIRGTDVEVTVYPTGAIKATAFAGGISVTSLDGLRGIETQGCQTVTVSADGIIDWYPCVGAPSIGIDTFGMGNDGGDPGSSNDSGPDGGDSGSSGSSGSSSGESGSSGSSSGESGGHGHGPGNGNGNAGNGGNGGGNNGGSGPGTGNGGGNNGHD